MTDAGAPPGPVEDAHALVRDGQAKFASGEVEQARTAFARALELEPDDAGAKAGLERCERLLKERESPPAEPGRGPSWPRDGARSEDFPDSGENPEATVVDPNYLAGIAVRGDAGASGDFPEPLTVPRAPIEKAGETPRPEGAGTPPPAPAQNGEPAYPRYVSTMPGNYPEVRPGGRPATSSPPPSSGTPAPGPMPVVAYPQMPPGGPSAYPHYPEPVSGYMPAPPPLFFPPSQQRRWMIITGSVGAGCLLLGLLLGWAIFGASDDEEPAAGAVTPLVARDAGGPTATKTDGEQPGATDAGAPKPPEPGGPAGAASARVTAIERPVLVTVTAPESGQIIKLQAKAAAQVKAGTPLYTIKGDKKAKTAQTVVEAPRAGRFEVRAAEGDTVSAGDVLGILLDPDAWLLIADVSGEGLATGWRCEAASGDGARRARCKVESVQELGGGRTRVAARVAARDAAWLKGDEKDLSLRLTPP